MTSYQRPAFWKTPPRCNDNAENEKSFVSTLGRKKVHFKDQVR